jgi:hypothetical protein
MTAPRRGARPRRVALAVLALLLPLAACLSRPALDEDERAALGAGRAALVLVRFECTFAGASRPCFEEPLLFQHRAWVALWLEDIDSVHDPEEIYWRPPTEAARRDGWMALALAPGIHYLYVQASERAMTAALFTPLRGAERFRVDVPGDARAIYAGTLRFPFDEPYSDLQPNVPGVTALATDDAAAAALVAATLIPDPVEVRAEPMRRWSDFDPLIFRSPGSPPGDVPQGADPPRR